MKKKDTPEGEKSPSEKLKLGTQKGREVEVFSIESTPIKNGERFIIETNLKEGLRLMLIHNSRGIEKPELQNEIQELIEIIEDYVKSMEYNISNDGQISFSIDHEGIITDNQLEREINDKIDKLKSHHEVQLAIHKIYGREREFLERIKEAEHKTAQLEQKTAELEEQLKEAQRKLKRVAKLHKQPRSYLKTVSQLVGKSTGETTLFSLPEKITTETSLAREVVSRNTAILGSHLLQLYQEQGGEKLIIDNLTPLAEIMGNTNHEVKIYLLYLGGYTYPIVKKNTDGLTLTTEQLFKIKLKYSKEVSDKYDPDSSPLIGNSLFHFIKNEPVEYIEITPNKIFIEGIKGKGLGNVLVVNDDFAKMALSLETDVAYKILTYSSSNKPTQKIGESNLVRHLGLDKQVKTQGRPRVRETILKGFKELQDKGHIKSYCYEVETQMFSYTYSDKFIKYSSGKKGRKDQESEEENGTS